jgi:hypothetical protein
MVETSFIWKEIYKKQYEPQVTTFLETYEDCVDLPVFRDEKPKENCKEVLRYIEDCKEYQKAEDEYYAAGTGMGIYERLPTLQVEKIKESNDFKIEALQESSVEIPLLGIQSFPLKVGNLEHLFKGPVTDPQGSNCWLNSLLVFLASNSSFVSAVLEGIHPKDSLGNTLKDLFAFWIRNHSKVDFRKGFDYFYGRVWLNMQRLGFQYGQQYSVIKAFQEIFSQLNMKEKQEDFVIMTQSNVQKMEGYEFKSCISHEVLAFTKNETPIGHSTCLIKNEHGTFYYDDILQMNDDFQGGLVKTFDLSPRNIQLSLFVKNEKKIQTLEQEVSVKTLKSFELPKERIPFTGKSTFSFDETLHLLHLVRFSCEFDMLDSFSFNQRIQPGKSLFSFEKKKLLVKREIESVLQSESSLEGMYLLCKLGAFDSLLTIPIEGGLKVSADLMDCLENIEKEKSIFKFFEALSEDSIWKKKRRKYRKVDLRTIFLSQLFYGKKEIKEMK